MGGYTHRIYFSDYTNYKHLALIYNLITQFQSSGTSEFTEMLREHEHL